MKPISIGLALTVVLIIPAHAQWVQTAGPEGGGINVIFYDPAGGGYLCRRKWLLEVK